MKLYNKHAGNVPADAIYIGRPTKWGNPFSHMQNTAAQYKVASREEAVSSYEEWIQTKPELIMDLKKELRGKSLVCFCAPLRCHGEVLMRLANLPDAEDEILRVRSCDQFMLKERGLVVIIDKRDVPADGPQLKLGNKIEVDDKMYFISGIEMPKIYSPYYGILIKELT